MKAFEKAQNLEDVKARIQEILDHCYETSNPLGYFAALYTKVAANIEKAIINEEFENNEELIRLDVNFVNYYIEAMNCAFQGKSAPLHWQVAIDADTHTHVLVLEHLFAAMNAHINYDLSNAVHDTVKPSDTINFKADFMKVNAILFGMLDEIQDNISTIFHPLKWYLKLGQRIDDKVISLLMGHMRNDAFSYSCLLALCSPKQCDEENAARIQEIADLSQKILHHKKWYMRLLIGIFRALEIGSVQHKIKQILK
jgi:hypothetical protein